MRIKTWLKEARVQGPARRARQETVSSFRRLAPQRCARRAQGPLAAVMNRPLQTSWGPQSPTGVSQPGPMQLLRVWLFPKASTGSTKPW
eukprot:4253137-Pyramimonas_sp.AAC.1